MWNFRFKRERFECHVRYFNCPSASLGQLLGPHLQVTTNKMSNERGGQVDRKGKGKAKDQHADQSENENKIQDRQSREGQDQRNDREGGQQQQQQQQMKEVRRPPPLPAVKGTIGAIGTSPLSHKAI